MVDKYFGKIILQAKDETCDWRAFVHCRDSSGQWWELRGYGDSAESAAKHAWEQYLEDEKFWENFGCHY